MDQVAMWSLAETGYSLTAIAAVAVTRCIWQRAPRGREAALLCGSILILGVHYGCLATDAFMHASDVRMATFTPLAAFGQVALIASWTFLVAFLLVVLNRLYTPARPSRWLVGTVIGHMGVAGALALWNGGRLAFALLHGSASDSVEQSVRALVDSPGGHLTAMCLAGQLVFCGLLFDKLPTRDGSRWPFGVERTGTGASVRSRLATAATHSLRTHPLRLPALLFLWAAWFVGTPSSHIVPPWTSFSFGGGVMLRILLLPTLLTFVHFVAPFLFFDVLVKRGIMWTALTALVTVPAFTLAGPRVPDHAISLLGLGCVAGTLFIGSSAALVDQGNRWLDRVLFDRANYRMELQTITAAMATAPDTSTLTTTITGQLATALRAEFVRFTTEREDPTPLAVGVGTANRPRGYLILGPRARGQQYGSEDLTFVYAVAAQLAGHLEACEARASAQLAAAAELKALRAQINPHFLFNALNTLADMADGQPETERTILNLSRVFRYALESTHQERVPLGTEIEAVRAYLEIEAARFEEQVRFAITIPDELLDVPVPPMLLQPLVENAVTHGVSTKIGGGTVRIDAVGNNGHLRLTVRDDGVGFEVDHTPPRIGLANVVARVERTGGTWRVQSIPGAGTEITLMVATS